MLNTTKVIRRFYANVKNHESDPVFVRINPRAS